MAIVKEIETGFGINANYFRVRDITINNDKKLIGYNIQGFISKEARQENKSPIFYESGTLSFEDAEYTTNDNIFEKVYDYIKTSEEFAGAADLI